VVDLLDHVEDWGPITEVVDELQAMPSSLPVRREVAHSAWVTIQVGCNNSCTFCIVPAVRGPEISRRPGDILREVRQLVEDGVTEVTLLGQNVDTYGRDLALDGRRRPLFAQLLRQVGGVDGVRRVRFTSPHPNDFRREVAEAMAETAAVCEQLHFPLQSGSNDVLRRMHRGYTAEKYLDRLRMAREVIPDLSVSTDVIVGFPGETDADFDATLAVLAEAQFDQAFTFIFSPRPGTAADQMTEDFVDPDVITERFGRLLELQNSITAVRSRRWIGSTLEVLSEGPSKKDPSVATTRTRGGKVVHVDRVIASGSYVDVRVESSSLYHLRGVLV
jgi:tRNA-2-methylthio-N6-dimethylallyladenosine synthase